MLKCNSKAKSVKCSTDDPHRFTVNNRWIECLAHAERSERLGRAVKLILT